MGLSQTSLANIVNVSKQAISQYENGIDSPGEDVFTPLRNVLRHEAHFFIRPSFFTAPATRFYRSMASATRTARARAESRQLWIRELLFFISEFVDLPPVDIQPLAKDPKLISMEDIEALAADVRKAWGLHESPIANLTDVAESRGIVVIRQQLDSAALDALSEWLQPENRPFVVLNADKNVGVRSRLDLAHEIGHMILHRQVSMEQLKDDECFDLVESQAFRFGAALLLPEQPFLEDLFSVSLDGLKAIKPKWKVSIAMMIERLKDLSIINHEQHRRLRINYSTRRWNRVEPFENEIPVEVPTLLSKCMQLIRSRDLQSIEQISAATGFSIQWIEQLLTVPEQAKPEVSLKLVELKRRA
jgi:Zn-dependent peptidase ImmA (M78 family)/transcriptional regulator with XRE-family HTH domain